MAVWSSVQLSKLGHAQRIEAEYYRPNYLSLCQDLERASAIPILRYLAYLTDGTHVTPKYVPNGIPFLSSSDVDPFVLPYKIEKFISKEEHSRLKHCQPDTNDILMSKSGRIGSCAVVPTNISKGDWNIYEGIALLRLTGISPHYAVAFLNSKYGITQIKRELKGVAQPHLHLEDIRRLKIFTLLPEHESEIEDLVKRGVSYSDKSHKRYTQAQQLLESELGLDKLSFDKPVGYTARFSVVGLSDSVSANRIDAQCFSPEAVFYEDWLLKHANCDRLSLLLASTAKGRQQAEADTGTTDYCSIKHITGREIVGASKTYPSAGTPTARKDDLLLAITGATIGKIGIVNRYNNLVFSGDLLRLRANGSVSPHYLLLTLDHHLGQVQFNRWITGSTNGHLAPRDVGRVLVPRLAPATEEQIVALVAESLEKRQKSEQLLNQAKSRVEQLIEEAVRA